MLTLLKVISFYKLLETNGGTSVLRVRSLVVLVSGFPLATRLVLGQVRQVKVDLSDIWHHFQPDFSSADRRHILLFLSASWTPGRLIELSLRFSRVMAYS